jgi:sterol desaturase/sphingolipid hydroxylase (fatty acid hydroxylase superfamily)
MLQVGLPIHPAPEAGLAEFLALFAACYGGLLALYFLSGGLLQWVNRRHPERRIQTRVGKNQIAMEIRQSVWSLSSIALYLAGGLFAQAKGWTVAPWELSFGSFALTFVIALVLYDTWFYWSHRLMHTRALYRFHAHHHKSLVPTPWSNNSDTIAGVFVEQSYFLLIPFILPIPPAALIALKIVDHVTAMIGHAGHEYFASPTTRWPWPNVCTTFHDQHHRHFSYNYANIFSWWDRAMGTLHPSYDETVRRFERRPQTAKEARP